MPTSNPVVTLTRDGSVARVCLNRPDKHNALNVDVITGLLRIARSLRRDRDLRAVILHGEGPSFCSGLDFPQVTRRPGWALRSFVTRAARGTNVFQEVCWAWRRLPVPVIAAIHGSCFGGGLQLALAADFRLATPDARLSILEAKWGLIPDMSGSAALRELLPIDQAKLLAMTGRTLSGEDALALRLVTAVVGDPIGEARALTAELMTRSPDAVAGTKKLFQDNWVADEAEAFRTERRVQAHVLMGKNQRIALKANAKKEPPRFGRRFFGF